MINISHSFTSMKKILAFIVISILTSSMSFAYTLNTNDKILGESLAQRIDEYDISQRVVIISKIEEIIYKWNYSDRINAILDFSLISLRALQNPAEPIQEVVVTQVKEEKPQDSKRAEDEEKIEYKEEPEDRETTEDEENTQEILTEHPGGNTVNLDIVKNNWLDWNNGLRNDLWLNPYSTSSTLENSAQVWSEQSKTLWDITHKRNPGDWYYNYNAITSWFANNWVVCENVSRITHTENIWWGTYSCRDGDCSEELSIATRSTFDYFLSEKWKTYDAHYRSLTQPLFTKIWLGVAVDEISENYYKYYLTIHYCTELID